MATFERMRAVATIIAARALAPVEAAIGGWRGFVTARQARARLEALLADQDRPPETDPDYPLSLYFVLNANNPLNQLLQPQIEAIRQMNYPTVFQLIKDDRQAGQYLKQAHLEEIGRWADSLDRI